MIIANPNIQNLIELNDGRQNEIIIESQMFFNDFLSDIVSQINGCDGITVLSENNIPIEWSKTAEIVFDFVPFQINRKNLLSKILQKVEKESLNSQNYEQTLKILQSVNSYIKELCFEMPFDFELKKLTFQNILKAIGFELYVENLDNIEKIFNYLELSSEFENKKLFIFVNMRSYFDDEKMQLFLDTSISHGIHIVLIESSERPKLKNVERLTIDSDLCEF